ncbi:MAG TPA: response regulator transcription factor [Nitriliruptorales bacterium]|nr:response regulator transcription factor [Nitriliruptorales bacterium]
MPTILVVDDDRAVRDSLERALRLHGFRVQLAANGLDGLQAVQRDSLDAIVLDVAMPGVDGVQLTRRLRQEGRGIPILMLTARDAVSDRVLGLDAGADDYLVKPFALEELLARLRVMLRRVDGGRPAEQPRRFADLVLDPERLEVRRGNRRIDLTRTEFDLLAAFLDSPRRVLSKRRLLEVVWGRDTAATSNTVEVYVGYLRRKLEAGGRPRLIHTVRGFGYVLRSP